MPSLLLSTRRNGIITPELSMPSSPTLALATVTPTTATFRHDHLKDLQIASSSVDLAELAKRLQTTVSLSSPVLRNKHPQPQHHPSKPVSPSSSFSSMASASSSNLSTAHQQQQRSSPKSHNHHPSKPLTPSSSSLSSSSSSSSSFDLAVATSPGIQQPPKASEDRQQQKQRQEERHHDPPRPTLTHRPASDNTPAQFVFKKPEYDQLYLQTHFHHNQQHHRDSSSVKQSDLMSTWSDLRRLFVSAETAPLRDDKAAAFGNQFRQDIGARYGKWGRYIGKGAGGSVRLIQRGSDGRLFAVKRFRRQLPHESAKDYIKKVTAEFCIGYTIHHPNVIETFDIIQEGNLFYEIMEYAPNDLFNLVMSGMMSREEIACCWRQLLQGLDYLHNIGIAHRDLKLDNLMLDHLGILKIIDFGCSCVFKSPFEETIERCRGIYGSDPYIAPEIFSHTAYDPRAADIWSCGIIFICMTIRRFPWRIARASDPAFKAYATNQNHQQLRMLKLLPRETRPAIASMMRVNPDKRVSLKNLLNDKWIDSIDVCSATVPGTHHVHHVLTLPPTPSERDNLVVLTTEPPGAVAEKEKKRRSSLPSQKIGPSTTLHPKSPSVLRQRPHHQRDATQH
ncbi:kinase-like domain-containing protein [Dichotomocladium elegans]|nr:kinase-like domain-containing protein [Dichotomocladium elegans]